MKSGTTDEPACSIRQGREGRANSYLTIQGRCLGLYSVTRRPVTYATEYENMKKRLLSNITRQSLWTLAETEKQILLIGHFSLLCSLRVC